MAYCDFTVSLSKGSLVRKRSIVRSFDPCNKYSCTSLFSVFALEGADLTTVIDEDERARICT